MKRVLLITLQGANIGNRLQNYALQEIIKQTGDICVYTPYYDIPEYDTVLKKLKISIKLFLSKIGFTQYSWIEIVKRRECIFQRFDERYIDNRFKTSYKLKDSNFDFAVTGSDQVWHKWSNKNNELDYFYLRFMPKDKRISYAASFGFDSFPQSDIGKHIDGLYGIKYLSCREEEGKKLIRDLVDRDAEIALDPTLLLDIENWVKIEKKPHYQADNYVLVYFLGRKSDECTSVIKKIADENSLNIIDVYEHSALEYFFTSPDEFIWLIHNASFICTDSYHACVFSILFYKKFLVFHRQGKGMEKMFDRIKTLFNVFGVNREYKGDYTDIYKDYRVNDISDLKKKSIDFLKNALGEN